VPSIVAAIRVTQPSRATDDTTGSNASARAPASDPWPSLPDDPRFHVDAEEQPARAPSMPHDGTEAPSQAWPAAMMPDVAAPPPSLPLPAPLTVFMPHPTQGEADEAGYWVDLPEKGIDAWHLQSSRLLLREQVHLARLMAEQAGCSWSAPHS
jgi:hypothetical protein